MALPPEFTFEDIDLVTLESTLAPSPTPEPSLGETLTPQQTATLMAESAAPAQTTPMPEGWVGPPTNIDVASIQGGPKYLDILERNQKGRMDFLEGISEWDKEDIPFLGHWNAASHINKQIKTIRKLKAGVRPSDEELVDLNFYIQTTKRMSEAKLLGKVGEGIKNLGTFMTEFLAMAALTAGTPGLPDEAAAAAGQVGGVAAKAAAKKTAQSALARMTNHFLWKSTSASAGSFAKAGYAAADIGVRGLIYTALNPGLAAQGRAQQRMKQIVNKGDINETRALTLGFLDAWIEHSSEASGLHMGRLASKILPKRLGNLLVGHGAQRMAAKKFGISKTNDFFQWVQRAGANGIVEEMAEERLGGFLRGITGVEGQAGLSNAVDQMIPTWEQSKVEFMVFAVPSAIVMTGGRIGKAQALGGAGMEQQRTWDEVIDRDTATSDAIAEQADKGKESELAQAVADTGDNIDKGREAMGALEFLQHKLFGRQLGGLQDTLRLKRKADLVGVYRSTKTRNLQANKTEAEARDAGLEAVAFTLGKMRDVQTRGIIDQQHEDTFKRLAQEEKIIERPIAEDLTEWTYADDADFTEPEIDMLLKSGAIKHYVNITDLDADMWATKQPLTMATMPEWESAEMTQEQKDGMTEQKKWVLRIAPNINARPGDPKILDIVRDKYNALRKLVSSLETQKKGGPTVGSLVVASSANGSLYVLTQTNPDGTVQLQNSQEEITVPANETEPFIREAYLIDDVLLYGTAQEWESVNPAYAVDVKRNRPTVKDGDTYVRHLNAMPAGASGNFYITAAVNEAGMVEDMIESTRLVKNAVLNGKGAALAIGDVGERRMERLLADAQTQKRQLEGTIFKSRARKTQIARLDEMIKRLENNDAIFKFEMMSKLQTFNVMGKTQPFDRWFSTLKALELPTNDPLKLEMGQDLYNVLGPVAANRLTTDAIQVPPGAAPSVVGRAEVAEPEPEAEPEPDETAPDPPEAVVLESGATDTTGLTTPPSETSERPSQYDGGPVSAEPELEQTAQAAMTAPEVIEPAVDVPAPPAVMSEAEKDQARAAITQQRQALMTELGGATTREQREEIVNQLNLLDAQAAAIESGEEITQFDPLFTNLFREIKENEVRQVEFGEKSVGVVDVDDVVDEVDDDRFDGFAVDPSPNLLSASDVIPEIVANTPDFAFVPFKFESIDKTSRGDIELLLNVLGVPWSPEESDAVLRERASQRVPFFYSDNWGRNHAPVISFNDRTGIGRWMVSDSHPNVTIMAILGEYDDPAVRPDDPELIKYAFAEINERTRLHTGSSFTIRAEGSQLFAENWRDQYYAPGNPPAFMRAETLLDDRDFWSNYVDKRKDYRRFHILSVPDFDAGTEYDNAVIDPDEIVRGERIIREDQTADQILATTIRQLREDSETLSTQSREILERRMVNDPEVTDEDVRIAVDMRNRAVRQYNQALFLEEYAAERDSGTILHTRYVSPLPDFIRLHEDFGRWAAREITNEEFTKNLFKTYNPKEVQAYVDIDGKPVNKEVITVQLKEYVYGYEYPTPRMIKMPGERGRAIEDHVGTYQPLWHDLGPSRLAAIRAEINKQNKNRRDRLAESVLLPDVDPEVRGLDNIHYFTGTEVTDDQKARLDRLLNVAVKQVDTIGFARIKRGLDPKAPAEIAFPRDHPARMLPEHHDIIDVGGEDVYRTYSLEEMTGFDEEFKNKVYPLLVNMDDDQILDVFRRLLRYRQPQFKGAIPRLIAGEVQEIPTNLDRTRIEEILRRSRANFEFSGRTSQGNQRALGTRRERDASKDPTAEENLHWAFKSEGSRLRRTTKSKLTQDGEMIPVGDELTEAAKEKEVKRIVSAGTTFVGHRYGKNAEGQTRVVVDADGNWQTKKPLKDNVERIRIIGAGQTTEFFKNLLKFFPNIEVVEHRYTPKRVGNVDGVVERVANGEYDNFYENVILANVKTADALVTLTGDVMQNYKMINPERRLADHVHAGASIIPARLKTAPVTNNAVRWLAEKKNISPALAREILEDSQLERVNKIALGNVSGSGESSVSGAMRHMKVHHQMQLNPYEWAALFRGFINASKVEGKKKLDLAIHTINTGPNARQAPATMEQLAVTNMAYGLALALESPGPSTINWQGVTDINTMYKFNPEYYGRVMSGEGRAIETSAVPEDVAEGQLSDAFRSFLSTGPAVTQQLVDQFTPEDFAFATRILGERVGADNFLAVAASESAVQGIRQALQIAPERQPGTALGLPIPEEFEAREERPPRRQEVDAEDVLAVFRREAEGEPAPQPEPVSEPAPALEPTPGPTVVRPSEPLNVWHSTGENADLSNLAYRPFKDAEGRQYLSVEHAYQTWKSGTFDEQIYSSGRWLFVPGGDTVSVKGGRPADQTRNLSIMKNIMRMSFNQNADHKGQLLATGNRPFTHDQADPFWQENFPRLLTELREEFRTEVPTGVVVTVRPERPATTLGSEALWQVVTNEDTLREDQILDDDAIDNLLDQFTPEDWRLLNEGAALRTNAGDRIEITKDNFYRFAYQSDVMERVFDLIAPGIERRVQVQPSTTLSAEELVEPEPTPQEEADDNPFSITEVEATIHSISPALLAGPVGMQVAFEETMRRLRSEMAKSSIEIARLQRKMGLIPQVGLIAEAVPDETGKITFYKTTDPNTEQDVRKADGTYPRTRSEVRKLDRAMRKKRGKVTKADRKLAEDYMRALGAQIEGTEIVVGANAIEVSPDEAASRIAVKAARTAERVETLRPEGKPTLQQASLFRALQEEGLIEQTLGPFEFSEAEIIRRLGNALSRRRRQTPLTIFEPVYYHQKKGGRTKQEIIDEWNDKNPGTPFGEYIEVGEDAEGNTIWKTQEGTLLEDAVNLLEGARLSENEFTSPFVNPEKEWIQKHQRYIKHLYKNSHEQATRDRIADMKKKFKFKEEASTSQARRFETYERAAAVYGLVPVSEMRFDDLYLKRSNDVWRAATNKAAMTNMILQRDADGSPMVLPRFNEETAKLDSNDVSSVISDDNVFRALDALADHYNMEAMRQGKKSRMTIDRDGNPRIQMNKMIDKFINDFPAAKKDYTTLKADQPNFTSFIDFHVKKGSAEKVLKKLVDVPYSGPFANAVQMFNAITKEAGLALSLFHPVALLESLSAMYGLSLTNPAAPWNWEQVWFGATQLHRRSQTDPEFFQEWVNSGLIVSTIDPNLAIGPNAQAGFTGKALDWVKGKNLPALSWGADKLGKFRMWNAGLLWGKFHPALKLYVAEHVLNEVGKNPTNWGYREDFGDRSQAMKDISQLVNDALGGQEFEQYMWATPKLKQMLHMVFFAPDWSLSAIKIAGTLPGLDAVFNPQASKLQKDWGTKRYWPGMALIVMFMIPNAVQAMIYAAAATAGVTDDDDKPFIWQNEVGKDTGPFGIPGAGYIDITPLMKMLAIHKGGETGRRRVYLRFAKQATEIFEGWFTRPISQAKGKMSTTARTALEQITSKNTAGWDLDFQNEGFSGIFYGDKMGVWGGRWAYVGRKFLPLSVLSWLDGKPAAFVAPTSRGMSKGSAQRKMAEILMAYADENTWSRIENDERRKENLAALFPELMDAVSRNGYDEWAVFAAAKRNVLSELYNDFYKALNKGQDRELERIARGILRVHGTIEGMQKSLKRRYANAGKDFPPDLFEKANQSFADAQGLTANDFEFSTLSPRTP